MDTIQVLLTLFMYVIPSSASCYYYHYYYCDYSYWSTARSIGAAVGGAISLIVCIVVVILLCRFCNRRPAYRGTTFTSAPNVSTVTSASQNMSTTYYPQPSGFQTPYQAQYPYGQPAQQQPMTGYSNFGYNPPSYDQVVTKPGYPPTAPQAY